MNGFLQFVQEVGAARGISNVHSIDRFHLDSAARIGFAWVGFISGGDDVIGTGGIGVDDRVAGSCGKYLRFCIRLVSNTPHRGWSV